MVYHFYTSETTSVFSMQFILNAMSVRLGRWFHILHFTENYESFSVVHLDLKIISLRCIQFNYCFLRTDPTLKTMQIIFCGILFWSSTVEGYGIGAMLPSLQATSACLKDSYDPCINACIASKKGRWFTCFGYAS
jgi:hypothetical protein